MHRAITITSRKAHNLFRNKHWDQHRRNLLGCPNVMKYYSQPKCEMMRLQVVENFAIALGTAMALRRSRRIRNSYTIFNLFLPYLTCWYIFTQRNATSRAIFCTCVFYIKYVYAFYGYALVLYAIFLVCLLRY